MTNLFYIINKIKMMSMIECFGLLYGHLHSFICKNENETKPLDELGYKHRKAS